MADRIVTGYMCKVDWDYEIGSAYGGSKVYPSVEGCKEHSPCVNDECGIVEVEVRLSRVVKNDDFRAVRKVAE